MASAPPQDRPQERLLRRTGPLYPRPHAASGPEQPARLAGHAPLTPSIEPRAHRTAGVDIRPLRPTGPIIAPRGVAIASTPAAAPSRVTSIAPAAPLAPVPTPLHANRPAVSGLLLHPVKSFALLVSLLADRRISRARKVAFAVPVALLMLGLVIPQTAVGVLAGLVAPRFGLAFQLPIDATLDWIGVTLLGSTLLRVFPRPIVAQYHARMFHAERAA